MKHLVQALVQHLMGSLEATLGDGPGFGTFYVFSRAFPQTSGFRPWFWGFFSLFSALSPKLPASGPGFGTFYVFFRAFPQTAGFRTRFWNILRLFSVLSPKLPASGPGFGPFYVFFPRFPPNSRLPDLVLEHFTAFSRAFPQTQSRPLQSQDIFFL